MLPSSNEPVTLSSTQIRDVDANWANVSQPENTAGRKTFSSNAPSLPESNGNSGAMDTMVFEPSMIPAIIPAQVGDLSSLKLETPLFASPKSNLAAEAAGKAARMAQELKALIDNQAQHARFQAVQAAATQQIAAGLEHEKSKKNLETAYMHKVEEAAVLRRECAKLQETIGALKLNLGGPTVQLPKDREGSSQHEDASSSQNGTTVLAVGFQVNLAFFLQQ
jgi:hypothetical protein